MGMSASQARLLSLTSRLSNLELKAQNIQNQKIRLAEKSAEASKKYMNALNAQNLFFNSDIALAEGTVQSITDSGQFRIRDLKGRYYMCPTEDYIQTTGTTPRKVGNSEVKVSSDGTVSIQTGDAKTVVKNGMLTTDFAGAVLETSKAGKLECSYGLTNIGMDSINVVSSYDDYNVYSFDSENNLVRTIANDMTFVCSEDGVGRRSGDVEVSSIKNGTNGVECKIQSDNNSTYEYKNGIITNSSYKNNTVPFEFDVTENGKIKSKVDSNVEFSYGVNDGISISGIKIGEDTTASYSDKEGLSITKQIDAKTSVSLKQDITEVDGEKKYGEEVICINGDGYSYNSKDNTLTGNVGGESNFKYEYDVASRSVSVDAPIYSSLTGTSLPATFTYNLASQSVRGELNDGTIYTYNDEGAATVYGARYNRDDVGADPVVDVYYKYDSSAGTLEGLLDDGTSYTYKNGVIDGVIPNEANEERDLGTFNYSVDNGLTVKQDIYGNDELLGTINYNSNGSLGFETDGYIFEQNNSTGAVTLSGKDNSGNETYSIEQAEDGSITGKMEAGLEYTYNNTAISSDDAGLKIEKISTISSEQYDPDTQSYTVGNTTCAYNATDGGYTVSDADKYTYSDDTIKVENAFNSTALTYNITDGTIKDASNNYYNYYGSALTDGIYDYNVDGDGTPFVEVDLKALDPLVVTSDGVSAGDFDFKFNLNSDGKVDTINLSNLLISGTREDKVVDTNSYILSPNYSPVSLTYTKTQNVFKNTNGDYYLATKKNDGNVVFYKCDENGNKSNPETQVLNADGTTFKMPFVSSEFGENKDLIFVGDYDNNGKKICYRFYNITEFTKTTGQMVTGKDEDGKDITETVTLLKDGNNYYRENNGVYTLCDKDNNYAFKTNDKGGYTTIAGLSTSIVSNNSTIKCYTTANGDHVYSTDGPHEPGYYQVSAPVGCGPTEWWNCRNHHTGRVDFNTTLDADKINNRAMLPSTDYISTEIVNGQIIITDTFPGQLAEDTNYNTIYKTVYTVDGNGNVNVKNYNSKGLEIKYNLPLKYAGTYDTDRYYVYKRPDSGALYYVSKSNGGLYRDPSLIFSYNESGAISNTTVKLTNISVTDDKIINKNISKGIAVDDNYTLYIKDKKLWRKTTEKDGNAEAISSEVLTFFGLTKNFGDSSFVDNKLTSIKNNGTTVKYKDGLITGVSGSIEGKTYSINNIYDNGVYKQSAVKTTNGVTITQDADKNLTLTSNKEKISVSKDENGNNKLYIEEGNLKFYDNGGFTLGSANQAKVIRDDNKNISIVDSNGYAVSNIAAAKANDGSFSYNMENYNITLDKDNMLTVSKTVDSTTTNLIYGNQNVINITDNQSADKSINITMNKTDKTVNINNYDGTVLSLSDGGSFVVGGTTASPATQQHIRFVKNTASYGGLSIYDDDGTLLMGKNDAESSSVKTQDGSIDMNDDGSLVFKNAADASKNITMKGDTVSVGTSSITLSSNINFNDSTRSFTRDEQGNLTYTSGSGSNSIVKSGDVLTVNGMDVTKTAGVVSMNFEDGSSLSTSVSNGTTLDAVISDTYHEYINVSADSKGNKNVSMLFYDGTTVEQNGSNFITTFSDNSVYNSKTQSLSLSDGGNLTKATYGLEYQFNKNGQNINITTSKVTGQDDKISVTSGTSNLQYTAKSAQITAGPNDNRVNTNITVDDEPVIIDGTEWTKITIEEGDEKYYILSDGNITKTFLTEDFTQPQEELKTSRAGVWILEDPITGHYKEVKHQNTMSDSKWLLEQLQSANLFVQKYSKETGWSDYSYIASSLFVVESDNTEIAKAEAEYEYAMAEIQSKDKRFDRELKNVETEHAAIEKERDDVKGVIDKSVSKTFKIFG